FDHALLLETVFADVDLSGCKGLETCQHIGPSSIDIRTLQRSGPLLLAFLRGVGLPDALIEYLPSLLNQAIQHYSCFISYSSKDDAFARRLHADLQAKGVRCWFAPEDMRIGAKILDTIDEAIRLRLPSGDDANALARLRVVRDQREVPAELDDARQLAALVIGAADGFGGGLVHGEHAAPRLGRARPNGRRGCTQKNLGSLVAIS